MTNYYPELDNEALEILLENVLHTEGYLDDRECPYSSKVKRLLKKEQMALDEVEDLDLVAESTRLFTELKEAKDNLGDDDHSEAMAYFRTSTSLLDKLVTLRERSNNVKQVSLFYGTVLGILEELLEADQITEVRERLKGFV